MSKIPTPADAILAFSNSQPSWIQDALRRVCLRRELTAEDYDELVALLKAQASGVPPDSAKPAEPLRAEHLPARDAGAPQTVLASIGDIANVNRLASAQTLSFAINGVTLVYGENGSGKSGYCRLLKKLCRVRNGVDEAVLGNVFATAREGRAQVKVRFREGDGQVQDPLWTDGDRAPSALSRISVFDSRAAPVYVDAESRIEVLPYLLDLLPRLGVVVQELQRRIEAEEKSYDAKVQTHLEPAPAGSFAANLIERLQKTSSDDTIPTEAKIRTAATWDEASEQELKQIEADLGTDPATRASNARTTARSWSALSEQLLALEALLSVAAVDAVRSQLRHRDDAAAAAAIAASDRFSVEPLRGVGSNPWRQMFRYAREYSAAAYPAADFPVPGPNGRCVLCQQELDEDSRKRLRQFDEFVRDTASEEAARQVAAVQATSQQIADLHIPGRTNIDQVLTPRPELDAALAASITAYCDEAEQAKRIVCSGLAGGEPIQLSCGLGASPAEELRLATSRLVAEADRLDELARNYTKQAERHARRLELIGMKALAPRLRTLLARREDLEARHALRATKTLCDTRAISTKNTDLRRLYLTQEFGERLHVELKALGLDYLPIKVTDRTERGASLVGVALQTVVPINNNRSILSEGEFRGLALATFLAEIGGYGDQHGIVVDDPVSSLDHRHRRQVAERLIAEAQKGRQVIIFTHDLAFFHEAREAAAATVPQVPVTNHEVRITAEKGCGTVFIDEEPWIAKKVDDRIQRLRRRLPELDSVPDRTSEAYRLLVKSIRTDIRETWERLVEEVLLFGVVGRYQTEVKTQNLKGVVVDDDDHARVYFEMGKASRCSGHDRAMGLQQSEATPEELKKDVDALADYFRRTKERRKEAILRREAKQTAPAGITL